VRGWGRGSGERRGREGEKEEEVSLEEEDEGGGVGVEGRKGGGWRARGKQEGGEVLRRGGRVAGRRATKTRRKGVGKDGWWGEEGEGRKGKGAAMKQPTRRGERREVGNE